MNDLLLFAFVNFALCIASALIVVCRLNAMHRGVLLRVRIEYSIGAGALVMGAFQPWWGEWPQWGSCALASYVLASLIASAKAWRQNDTDEPPEIATDRMPLEKL